MDKVHNEKAKLVQGLRSSKEDRLEEEQTRARLSKRNEDDQLCLGPPATPPQRKELNKRLNDGGPARITDHGK